MFEPVGFVSSKICIRRSGSFVRERLSHGPFDSSTTFYGLNPYRKIREKDGNPSCTHLKNIDRRDDVILVVEERFLHRFTDCLHGGEVDHKVDLMLRIKTQSFPSSRVENDESFSAPPPNTDSSGQDANVRM